jgi:hypothetical protein
MQILKADQLVTIAATREERGRRWLLRWTAAVLATMAMCTLWQIDSYRQHVYSDAVHYRAMADGKTEMKPFAFRVLTPALARVFADTTGRSTADGFLFVGLASVWVLLYGVLYPVVERPWLVIALTLLPFWLRNLHDYFLPDLLHAALCMVYLVLLRRRWWGWASSLLAVMFLARESTLLLAVIAIPVVWRLVGKRAGLMQLGAGVVGVAVSKFVARNAYANLHRVNDTLYMVGKIPWNLSKNVLGVTLWTNTSAFVQPVRIWNVPPWMHLGGIHQIGYSAFGGGVLLLNCVQLLTSFGLGVCVVVCLVCKRRLRRLLPGEEPYLCVAAIYGVITFLMTPVLGASLVRLFDYGWPLFLVYLPVMMLRVWRSWPGWVACVLLSLHLVTAWMEFARVFVVHFSLGAELAILVGCNVVGAWLLLRTQIAGERGKTSYPFRLTSTLSR